MIDCVHTHRCVLTIIRLIAHTECSQLTEITMFYGQPTQQEQINLVKKE